jgi:hypothetical protein
MPVSYAEILVPLWILGMLAPVMCYADWKRKHSNARTHVILIRVFYGLFIILIAPVCLYFLSRDESNWPPSAIAELWLSVSISVAIIGLPIAGLLMGAFHIVLR